MAVKTFVAPSSMHREWFELFACYVLAGALHEAAHIFSVVILVDHRHRHHHDFLASDSNWTTFLFQTLSCGNLCSLNTWFFQRIKLPFVDMWDGSSVFFWPLHAAAGSRRNQPRESRLHSPPWKLFPLICSECISMRAAAATTLSFSVVILASCCCMKHGPRRTMEKLRLTFLRP